MRAIERFIELRLRCAGTAFRPPCIGSVAAYAQTPASVQEWQYPGAVTAQQLFEPSMPPREIPLGVAEVLIPRDDGAQRYHAPTGPVIDIRNRDIAFASAVEGIGVNRRRGAKYRVGIAIAYDFGRHSSDDPDFRAQAGAKAVGLGFNASRFLANRGLPTVDAAINRLLGSASESLLTQPSLQGVLALSGAYRW